MNVWVDKLPKNCDDCDLKDDGVWCCLTGELVVYNSDKRGDECPLLVKGVDDECK